MGVVVGGGEVHGNYKFRISDLKKTEPGKGICGWNQEALAEMAVEIAEMSGWEAHRSPQIICGA
jgi:hypothetical protein